MRGSGKGTEGGREHCRRRGRSNGGGAMRGRIPRLLPVSGR
jgi:hypothetical protein